jgi:hypothetical protein
LSVRRTEGVVGQLATFAAIGPDLFECIVAGADPDLAGCTVHSLDKAWEILHSVLRSKGRPLSLAIAGDCTHPQGGHSLDEFIDGGHDYYIALMSPRLVQEVAAALTRITAKTFKRWERELGGDRQSAVELFFPQLKAAYREAAAEKNGLMIVIA